MYAVIDIGSNTIRLSFYKYVRGQVEALMNKKTVAGLVSYVDSDNNLTQEGIDILVDVLNEYKLILKGLKTTNIYVFATASLRNVKNSKTVLKKISKATELKLDLLDEEQEASYGYFGAVQSVTLKEGLYIDIGGGSTELVFFKNNKILYSKSFSIGSLNAYIKFVSKLIPTKEEEMNLYNHVTKLLKTLPVIDCDCTNICGVGGTLRASLKLNEKRIHLKTNGYKSSDLELLLDREDYMKYITTVLKVKPDRIHTITTGMVILKAIADYYGSETIYISSYGVREGYLASKIKEI